eukprot:6181304-Pleurochrysis_carterae.AAC.2
MSASQSELQPVYSAYRLIVPKRKPGRDSPRPGLGARVDIDMVVAYAQILCKRLSRYCRCATHKDCYFCKCQQAARNCFILQAAHDPGTTLSQHRVYAQVAAFTCQST